MATPLVLCALNLNQRLDSMFLQLVLPRLYWDCIEKCWILENNQRKLLPYYFVFYCLVGGILFASPFALLCADFFLSLHLLSTKVRIAWSFILLFGFFPFFFDILVFWFGQDLVPCANYLFARQLDVTDVYISSTQVRQASIKKGMDLFLNAW